MIRLLFLAATLLVLPALAQAEDVWRWRDSSGQLHYSNIPSRVPSHAERIRTQLGKGTDAAPAPEAKEPEAAPTESDRPKKDQEDALDDDSPRPRHAVGSCAMGPSGYFCPRFPSMPWTLSS
jgi:hypothetical protein